MKASVFIATSIGRKTYETAAGFNPWPYGDKLVVVLTTTPSEFTPPESAVCEFMSGTPRDIVEQLAERGLKHLYVDGGVTIRGFLAAGLIQRLTITRIPVLLGDGIPLFGSLPRDIRLDHVAMRSYPSGLVESEYVIVP